METEKIWYNSSIKYQIQNRQKQQFDMQLSGYKINTSNLCKGDATGSECAEKGEKSWKNREF